MDWTGFERFKEIFPNRTENHAKIGNSSVLFTSNTSLEGAKAPRTERFYVLSYHIDVV